MSASNFPDGCSTLDVDRAFGNPDTRIDADGCHHSCVLCDAFAVPHELPERGEPGGGCDAFERHRRLTRRIAEIDSSLNIKHIHDLLCPTCTEFLDGFGYMLGGFEG